MIGLLITGRSLSGIRYDVHSQGVYAVNTNNYRWQHSYGMRTTSLERAYLMGSFRTLNIMCTLRCHRPSPFLIEVYLDEEASYWAPTQG